MNGMAEQKNLSIETLRGVAILLVVVGHVIGSGPDGGMRIGFPSPWRYLYLWIDYIQMPLFTAIAGWVYALKPAGSGSAATFVAKKARRLLVPMATVSTLYFLVQYFVPGTNSKEALGTLWQIYLFPYTIFWYLQALFLIFLAVLVLDRSGLASTPGGWAVALAGSFLLYVAQAAVIPYEVPNFFSFKGALDQLPYFIAGVGVCRFGPALWPKFKAPAYALAAVGIGLLQCKWFCPGFPPELYRSLLPLWLVPTLSILLNLSVRNKAFIFLGSFAYSIYLFHGFGTSGGRILLSYIGIHHRLVVFATALAAALLLPVAADRILSRSRLLRMLLLGKPYNKQ